MVLNSSLFAGQNVEFFDNIELIELANLLKDRIKNKKDCFEITNIVFPSDNMAQWFKTYWLSTESDVLMNIKFLSLEECLYSLLDLEKKFELAKRHEIRTVTIKAILLLDKASLEKKISDYIYDGDVINSVRLFDLADSVSKLFCNYEKEAFEFEGWQKTLYEMVMKELESHGVSSFSRAYKQSRGFKTSNETYYFFGFSEIDDLYVEPLKQLSEQNKVVFYAIKQAATKKIDISLLAAPSKIREIEALHTEICTLVKDEKAKFSDFLVLSPDTSAYERGIARVFNQDNESFPSVPFNINSKKRRETDVTEGLKKLFEISTKKFFTRLDFAEIINNKIIQKARSISPDNIDEWQQSIIEMNVFRNGKRIDDWAYAKKRLVLSKVADINSLGHNIVELTDDTYMPYTRIALEDDSIIKAIKVIDDLQEWIADFSGNPFLDVKSLDALRDQLVSWFSIKDLDGIENDGILFKLLAELNFWRTFGMDNGTIPLNTLFYSLLDRSQETNIKTSSLFVEGVTFADYDESSVLPAKYLFFLGANSKDFPPLERRSEIDLRPESDRLPLQYQHFESQCYNAGSKLFLSYVNRNLKTDEEYFPSTFLLKLFEGQSFDAKRGARIGIDETRAWSDLFTKKEYKEKKYYIGLFNTQEISGAPQEDTTPEPMKKVTVSQMKNFLTEPLKYKFEHLFGQADDTDDLLHDQYEPILLDKLTKSILVKSALLYWLKHPDAPLFDESGNANIPLTREIFHRFLIEHKIPNIDEELTDIQIAIVMEDVRVTKEDIDEVTTPDSNPGHPIYEIVKIPDYHFKFGEDDVLLMFNGELCLSIDGNTRKYIELSSWHIKPTYKCVLPMYVCALMDVASFQNDEEYQIVVHRRASQKFSITPEQARQLIYKIYESMNSYELNAYLPIDNINSKKMTKSFEKMVENAMSPNGEWSYFKDKTMFNPTKDLGYTRYTFQEQISAIKALMRELVLFVGPEPEEEEE